MHFFLSATYSFHAVPQPNSSPSFRARLEDITPGKPTLTPIGPPDLLAHRAKTALGGEMATKPNVCDSLGAIWRKIPRPCPESPGKSAGQIQRCWTRDMRGRCGSRSPQLHAVRYCSLNASNEPFLKKPVIASRNFYLCPTLAWC